jgi:hypothetical protein
VSPWVERGVCKTPFDHTSILRYVCDKWGLAPLGMRTDPAAGAFQAKSLAPELMTLGTAREDTPASIAGPPVPKARVVVAEPPVAGSREALLWFMANLHEGTPDGSEPADRQRAARVMSARKGQALRPLTDRQLSKAAERRFTALVKDKQAEPAGTSTKPPVRPKRKGRAQA